MQNTRIFPTKIEFCRYIHIIPLYKFLATMPIAWLILRKQAITLSSKLSFLPCLFDSMNWYGYCQTYETMTIDIPVFLNHG